jgi:epoxyqueuosine reductase
MNTLGKELTAFLKSSGASLVGFADLREIEPARRDGFPRSITIAMALPPEIATGIKDGPNRAYYDAYQRINARLDELGEATVRRLADHGYTARARPATFEEDRATLTAKLPHKTAATRAGLGWIGKNALLVTREYGPAVRLTTVLTDAALPVGEPVNASQCGDCTACSDACPARALAGNSWRPGLPRESLVEVFTCRRTARSLSAKSFGEEASICGICIAACPWTQAYLQRAAS